MPSLFVCKGICIFGYIRLFRFKVFGRENIFFTLSVKVYLFGMVVAFDSNLFLTLFCLGFVFDFSYIKL